MHLNFLHTSIAHMIDFPGGLVAKNSPDNSGDMGSILWSGKIPWRRKWQATPIFLPGKSHGERSYSPWGHKESDTTEQLNTHVQADVPGGDPRWLLLQDAKACGNRAPGTGMPAKCRPGGLREAVSCVSHHLFQNCPFLEPLWTSQVALVVKNPPATAGDVRVGSIPGLG